MGMSEFYGSAEEGEAKAVIERAIDLGVDLFVNSCQSKG